MVLEGSAPLSSNLPMEIFVLPFDRYSGSWSRRMSMLAFGRHIRPWHRRISIASSMRRSNAALVAQAEDEGTGNYDERL